MKEIDVTGLSFNPWEKIGKDWFLLTAGTADKWNTMTAAWGSAGVMWMKNTFNAVVRPTRYTYEFMEKNERFTVSFFTPQYKQALGFCGSHSGRDCDKAKETGLTPLPLDGSVAFEEAELVLVCKKLYAQDMEPSLGIPEVQAANGDEPMHKLYIGEILKAYTKE